MSFPKKADYSPEAWAALQAERAKNRAANKAAKAEESFPRQEIQRGEDEVALRASEPGDDGFRLFLATLDHETRQLLSDAELRKHYADGIEKALEEKRTEKRRSAKDKALQAARMAAGLVPADMQEMIETQRKNNEPFQWLCELPPSGPQGSKPDIGLRIDQKIFLDGTTHRCTRAEFDSRREMIYRVEQMERLFRGEGIRERSYWMSRATGTVNRHITLNPDGSLA